MTIYHALHGTADLRLPFFVRTTTNGFAMARDGLRLCQNGDLGSKNMVLILTGLFGVGFEGKHRNLKVSCLLMGTCCFLLKSMSPAGNIAKTMEGDQTNQ